MTTRIQHCPVDGQPLDTHTEADMIECEAALQADGRTTLPALTPLPKIHESWSYRLPERYQG